MAGTLENNQAYEELKGKIHTIPKVDDTLTKQGHSADAKKVGEELEARVKKADIVDGFTSTATDKPASANAVRMLKEELDNKNTSQSASVGYNNSASGLKATNMQSAVDELAENARNLAEDVDNCLPRTGGVVEGPLNIRTADNGYGQLLKNHSTDADYGTQVSDTSKDGKTAKLCVSAALNLLTFTDPEGNIRNIHHEGSKPFGSYKGNGSAVSRMIETGGIGRLALVYNPNHFSFVTPQGALVVKLSDGTIKWIEGGKIYFLNGTLGISTANEAFNSTDTDYYYQVI